MIVGIKPVFSDYRTPIDDLCEPLSQTCLKQPFKGRWLFGTGQYTIQMNKWGLKILTFGGRRLKYRSGLIQV